MGNFKIGETVALHILQDINLKIYVFPIDFTREYINENYKKNSIYKRSKIKKIKRLWSCFFKRMYLLDDGHWYSEKQLTPIVRVKASLKIEVQQEAIA